MEWLLNLGYLGLFFGSFFAATVIPFSSDVLLVGILVAGGNPYIAVPLATIGNWAGGMTSYALGWIGKWEWIEKYLKVSRKKLESQKVRICRYGSVLALFTWLPLVGDLMALALGFYKVDTKKTAIFMFIGKGARFVVLAIIYFWIKK